jgi:hypothetical protein
MHHIDYDEENLIVEPHTMKINRLDQVVFSLSSGSRYAIIYQTDEYGNRIGSEILSQCQQSSVRNYCMKEFSKIGIYYFSTNIINSDKRKTKRSSTYPLAIIVLPEICFHYKSIGNGNFDSNTIITTNMNDFIIWIFGKIISHDVVRLNSNDKFHDLLSSHSRAVVGKNRQCVAINCKSVPLGVSFFCNPGKQKQTNIQKKLLLFRF